MSTPNIACAFDHVPVGATTAGGNVPTYSDYGFVYATSQNSASVGGVMQDSNGTGWLYTQAGHITLAGNNVYMADGEWDIPITNVLDLSATRHWIGFRFKFDGSISPVGASTIVSIGTSPIALLNSNDYAWVGGTEYYVEVLVDLGSGTRSMMIDGALVLNKVAIATKTIATTDTFRLSWNTRYLDQGSANRTLYFKDMVFSSDSGTGTFGRQGPVVAKPITISSATGSSWAALDGTSTLAAALNKPITGTATSTDGVSMAPDGSALTASLSTTADPTLKICLVSLMASGERLAGTGTTLHTTLTSADAPGAELVFNTEQFPSGSFSYGRTLGVMPKAPDGSDWSAAKIEALTLTATAEAT